MSVLDFTTNRHYILAMPETYSLKEIQLKFNVPQHVLIHLCEKDVIAPDIADTQGRGRWREFSKRNLFEFALALEIRKYDIPVAKTGAIVNVLGAFEKTMSKTISDFSFPESLLKGPEIKFYIFNGSLAVFSLAEKSFISFDLEKLIKGDIKRVQLSKISKLPTEFNSYLEVNLSELAKSL